MTKTATTPRTFNDEFAVKYQLVNTAVDRFTQTLLAETAQEDIYSRATYEACMALLGRGGKRVRGVLAVTGYQLYGGAELEMIAEAAAAIEACHAYLLIIDDVADNSDSRRGGPTAHIAVQQFLDKHHVTGNTRKLGEDMAQAGALYVQHKAQSLLLNLPLPASRKVQAAALLNDGLARTGIGQIRDMSPVGFEAGIEAIQQIATYKTAFYTFLLPLQVGATLAGAPADDLDLFTDYSLNAGLAFQMQDDIIGSFGDESVTGKPRMSDIIEGKKTVLMAKALAKADAAQKRELLAALGNAKLTEPAFERCLEIIRDTGALQEASQLVDEYAQKAIDALPAHLPAKHVQFLRELALYSAQRQA